MSDVIRLNEVNKNLLKEYYDLLIKRYGSDCPFLQDSSHFSALIGSAIRDAISYNEWILSDSEV